VHRGRGGAWLTFLLVGFHGGELDGEESCSVELRILFESRLGESMTKPLD
jgi:hypothetical protein